MQPVPSIRIRRLTPSGPDPAGRYVLYWMIAYRRLTWNFSLQRAIWWALELDKPLVILEALRVGYPWACERFHRFILDGMADNARKAASYPVFYYPYVENTPGEGKGLLAALARQASIIITDDYPGFFLPRMVTSAAGIGTATECVDSNGLLPLRAADRIYPTAYAFRRFLQKTLPHHLLETPRPAPLGRIQLKRLPSLPPGVFEAWPPARDDLLEGRSNALQAFPIDHRILPGPLRGGHRRALTRLGTFIRDRLQVYPWDRNHPDLQGTSGISPYLHFGHLSAHQVFDRVKRHEAWSHERLSAKATGGKSGWWGMGEAAEAFLDELVTWRELGFNMCGRRVDYDRFESLPEWAVITLKNHEKDRRPYLYPLEAFKEARTHDRLWNAAQTQLLTEGRMHNYLRMLWGKKILEWTRSPRQALEFMIELNNAYALDGRDPNSYSGIFWILGRYDRAWGPERRVFGKVRYMSSKNTLRKVRAAHYVQRFAPDA